MTHHLPQTNNWSCVPTALEYATGVPRHIIMAEIGHDGSEIIRPENPEPRNRKGFHMMEQVKWADGRGYKNNLYSLSHAEAEVFGFRTASNDQMLWNLIQGKHAVCTVKSRRFAGVMHAVAWLSNHFVDPATGEVADYSPNDLFDAHIIEVPRQTFAAWKAPVLPDKFYHGTPANFDRFDTNYAHPGCEHGDCVYITDQHSEAAKYKKGPTGVVREVPFKGKVLFEHQPFRSKLFDQIRRAVQSHPQVDRAELARRLDTIRREYDRYYRTYTLDTALQSLSRALPDQNAFNQALSGLGYSARHYPEESGANSLAVFDLNSIQPEETPRFAKRRRFAQSASHIKLLFLVHPNMAIDNWPYKSSLHLLKDYYQRALSAIQRCDGGVIALMKPFSLDNCAPENRAAYDQFVKAVEKFQGAFRVAWEANLGDTFIPHLDEILLDHADGNVAITLFTGGGYLGDCLGRTIKKMYAQYRSFFKEMKIDVQLIPGLTYVPGMIEPHTLDVEPQNANQKRLHGGSMAGVCRRAKRHGRDAGICP